jgi:hypothetical protein
MESFIVITAGHLTRSADLRLAQMDQRHKKVGAGVGDAEIRLRLAQLKMMAALAPSKTMLVHLSCSDAQLLAPVALPPERPTQVGDININVRPGAPSGVAQDIIRAVRRNNRRLRS